MILEALMAAPLRAETAPQKTSPADSKSAAPSPRIASRPYLARLAALHDEAAETALLANLLGRAPYAAGAIAAAAVATALLSLPVASFAGLATWLVLVFAGIVAAARFYAKTIHAPFERAGLKAFAGDMSAVLLYAGFAWGAGAFLALPASAPVFALPLFGAGLAVVLAVVLRARDMAYCFLVPAIGLSALAPLLRPLDGGILASAGVLAAGIAAALVAEAAERLTAPRRLTDLAGLPAA
jgi:hypothetical protein